MKDLLLCVQVVVETLNLELSRYLAAYVQSENCTKGRAARAARLFHSTNEIIVVIAIREKLRRLLQRKLQIKIELCARLSVLLLFHVGHVVQNRQSTLFACLPRMIFMQR